MSTPYPGGPDPYGAGPDPYGADPDPYGAGPGAPGAPWGDPPVDGWAGDPAAQGWAGGPPSGSWPPDGGPPPPEPQRRGGVALVVVGALVVLGLVAVAAVVALTRSDDPGDFGAGPLSEPEEEWSVDLDADLRSDEDLGGSVVIRSDGDIVLLAWDGPYDEDTEELSGLEMRAFSADDGELLWQDQLDSESYGGPITLLGDGRMLVTEGYDDEAVTRMLDARTGDEIWEAEGSVVGTLFSGPFDVQNTDLPSDRLLLGVYEDGGESRSAVMVDLDSGDEIWSERDVDALDCGDGVITIDAGDPEADTGFDRLDPGEVDVVGRDGGSGDEIWSLQGLPGGCSDDVVAIATEDDEVVLVKVGSGRQSDPIDLGQGADFTTATPFGDNVLVNQFSNDDESGRTAIYRMGDGEPTWEDDVGYAFPLGEELVLVPDEDGGDASVIRAADGEELDDVEVPGFDNTCEGTIVPRTSLVCDDPSEVTSYALVGEVGERWTVDLGDDIIVLGIGGDRMFAVTGDQLVSYR